MQGCPVLLGFIETPLIALAAAVGAVSLPIIIHLLNRRRFRVVVWAAMRFLLAAQRKNSRRLRVEQLLLLAVRALIVLLLVLAMASVMPWVQPLWQRLFPGSSALAATHARTHKVFVLDGSFSMAAQAGDKSCFERARQKIMDMLDASHPGDGFSVVLMATPPELIVPEASDDPDEVRREIGKDNLYLPHGDANLADTLSAVENILLESPNKFVDRKVYFLTDLQRSTWVPRSQQAGESTASLAAQLKHIQERARMIFVDVGQEVHGNLAVTDLQFPGHLVAPRVATPLVATLHLFGREEGKKVAVELWAGRAASNGSERPFDLRKVRGGRAGKDDPWFELVDLREDANEPANPQEVEFPPGSNTLAVRFNLRFKTPGDYVVQVRLPHDALDLDNARSNVIRVKSVPVLIVNGRSDGDGYEVGIDDLKDSLNPFQKGTLKYTEFPQPRVVDVPTFEDPGQCDLSAYDCVFLCNVPRPTGAVVERLETHLRRGGGLVFALGPQVDLESYNRLLFRGDDGLLPGRLVPRKARGDEPAKPSFVLHADMESYKRPPLSSFDEDAYRASLTRARFQNYVGVEQLRPRARTILSFLPDWSLTEKGGGAPRPEAAVVEWKRYRGRVVLLTTTASREWSKWAPGPTYPAFMQELLHFAIGGRLREPEAIVGQPLIEVLDPGLAEHEAQVTVLHPALAREGEEVTPRPRAGLLDPNLDGCVLRLFDTSTSGIYRVTFKTDPPDPREYLFAVNVPIGSRAQPSSESDPTRTNRAALLEAYRKVKGSDQDFTWDFQIVTELGQEKALPPITRQSGDAVEEPAKVFPGTGVGASVARVLLFILFGLLLAEVVMAWKFGHHTAEAGPSPGQPAPTRRFVGVATGTVASVCALACMLLAGVLIHYALTRQFLGFLPSEVRTVILAWQGEPPTAPGEGVESRLEYVSYLSANPLREVLLVTVAALAALALVIGVYLHEGTRVGTRYRLMLAGIRGCFVLLVLLVLLPQLKLWFERQGMPVLAIILDDSESMGEPDRYSDASTREAARKLATLMRHKPDGLQPDQPQRLQIAQALLDREEPDWMRMLVEERKFRLHIYRLEDWARGKPRKEVNGPEDIPGALQALREIKAEGKSSPLGNRISQVRSRYRGSGLAGIVMMTDGITTRGKKRLIDAAEEGVRRSRQDRKKVPLFFVGIGSKQETRPDLYLDELQVADEVYANDRLVFEVKVTAQGYKNLTVPVTLSERDENGNLKKLQEKSVTTDALGTRVQFELRPDKPANDLPYEEKFYVIDVPVQKGARPEVDPDNNQAEATVVVHKAERRPIGVLYVDAAPRYEFRYLKNLLERELPDESGHKRVDVRVLLLDADGDWPMTDKSAAPLLDDRALPAEAAFPSRQQLLDPEGFYDVVILGDVDPTDRRLGKENLQNLADFVRKGGGLLMIAGDRFNPHGFRDTPLRDILPIELDPEAPRRSAIEQDGFRPKRTREHTSYPFLRFGVKDAESDATWEGLPKLKWWSEGYSLKPGANILLVHPTVAARKGERTRTGEDGHPLMVHQFVEGGRSLFFGIDETWRWRYRENEGHYNDFWRQVVQYLWRRQSTYPKLRLKRERLGQEAPRPGEPYRPGDLIRVSVTFPNNARPPDPDGPVKVDLQRKFTNLNGQVETERQTLELNRSKETPGAYEGVLTRTLSGEYVFSLKSPLPVTGVVPRAYCRVIPPREEDPALRRSDDPLGDDEMDVEHLYEQSEKARLSINADEMQRAADSTGGAYAFFPSADEMLKKVPDGKRVRLDVPSPPWLVWNQLAVFMLALGLIGSEWILRKRKHLL